MGYPLLGCSRNPSDAHGEGSSSDTLTPHPVECHAAHDTGTFVPGGSVSVRRLAQPQGFTFVGHGTTRWRTTLSSKVDLYHAINFRALCGANLFTSREKFPPPDTLVLHRMDNQTMPTVDSLLRASATVGIVLLLWFSQQMREPLLHFTLPRAILGLISPSIRAPVGPYVFPHRRVLGFCQLKGCPISDVPAIGQSAQQSCVVSRVCACRRVAPTLVRWGETVRQHCDVLNAPVSPQIQLVK
jgi:hypothetical protein